MSYSLLLKTSLLLRLWISERATITGFIILSINTSQTSDGLCDEVSASLPLPMRTRCNIQIGLGRRLAPVL
jgi:hypothetical protein